jgi:acetate kinase
MDGILVVNAGSSSVKFEVFAVDGHAKLTRRPCTSRTISRRSATFG